MELVSVTSRANETLRFARSLQEKKYRDKSRRFFTEGLTLFWEAQNASLTPETVILSDALEDSARQNVLDALSRSDTRVLCVPDSFYRSLSAEHAPQGVCAIYPFLEDTKNSNFIHKIDTKSPRRYIILEKIQDPGNAGSMLRSAAAFGYTGALLVGAADPYHPKTIRGSMGALFTLDVRVFQDLPELLEFCKAQNLYLYCTSPHAKQSITKTRFNPPFAVCFGNEGAGLSEELLAKSDECLSIPMQGMESLNAAAACAVVLYETQRSMDT